ncbi:MAG TPA: flagellar hook capping FlgD N-terminal domain-containing protein [Solirubrobacteraceae bacterium]|nr:flagellar hook capping FlgD N-terminal domain-containing protein [Solirubrobacteraceae bacterium]
MTNVTAADSTNTTPTGTTGTTVSRTDNGLGENDFLQLMMMQLQNQDPLNPSDPTQYLSELANFSTLEQETNIASSSATTASEQSTAAALGLLGHTVSYTDSSGATQSGAVTKIDFTSSGPALTIGGQTGITLGAITEVS